jgi:hypothetical protein
MEYEPEKLDENDEEGREFLADKLRNCSASNVAVYFVTTDNLALSDFRDYGVLVDEESCVNQLVRLGGAVQVDSS